MEGEELENFLFWVMLAAGELTAKDFEVVGAPPIVFERYGDVAAMIRHRMEERAARTISAERSASREPRRDELPPVGSRGLG